MNPVSPSAARFTATHWSVVLAAGASDSPAGNQALEALCRTYWPPLYAFARRLGKSPEDARDLTQGFFARFLEKNWIVTADSSQGRFRNFLLTAFRRYISDAGDRDRALKRGGRVQFVPLDLSVEEDGHAIEPGHWHTPEQAYEERWARVLIELVLSRLREEFVLQGRGALFDVLRDFLMGDLPGGRMAAAAADLGMSQGAVRMSLMRLRERYRQVLRGEIAQTVSSPQEVEDELRHLYHVLTGQGR